MNSLLKSHLGLSGKEKYMRWKVIAQLPRHNEFAQGYKNMANIKDPKERKYVKSSNSK